MFSVRKGERMEIDTDLVEKLLAGRAKPEQIIGEHGLLKRLTKALLERMLEAELNERSGYERHDPAACRYMGGMTTV